MTVTVEVIGKEYALLAIVSVNPGSVPCGPFKTPVTLTIDMDEDAPLGQFTVDLRGEILDDGLVVCETTLSLPVTVDLGVTTLTADPTSIPATTAWPGMPPYNLSNPIARVGWKLFRSIRLTAIRRPTAAPSRKSTTRSGATPRLTNSRVSFVRDE